MTPKKPDWFEMTEGDSSSSGIRKVNKKLPLIALLAAGSIIAAGSIFASTNSEPTAVAETPTASQSAAASQPVATTSKSSSGLNSVPAPTVSKVPQRGENGEGREGREDGGREGEGHDD